MRLLSCNADGSFNLTTFIGDSIPLYAILSHTWDADDQEYTFKDLQSQQGRSKNGYSKLEFCSERAERDGLWYFWIDSCCIDRSNSVELQEAINSMFRWYRDATRCYVYLSDVSIGEYPLSSMLWQSAFRQSRWFTRGWTVQELLAPRSVEFFSRDGTRLGDKHSLEQQIHEVTGIAVQALKGRPLSEFSNDERIAWAAQRKTTIEEDQVYCLLGIFNVYLPLIYGEGKQHALRRLQDEIHKRSTVNTQVNWNDMERKCMQALRTSDYEQFKDRNPDKLKGTCQWVLQHQNFRSWEDCSSSALLWVSADPGCGKSVLSKSLVDEDLKCAETRATCYFFFKEDDERQRSAANALSALLHQLFSQRPLLIKHATRDYEADGDKLPQNFHKLWAILTTSVTNPKAGEVICVLDALDECAEAGRYQIIDAVNAFYQPDSSPRSSSQLKFIITSRPYLDIERRFANILFNFPAIRLQGERESEVITREIDAVIKWRVSKLGPELKLDNTEQATLESELLRTTHRTYLWLTLILDIVCKTLHPTSRKLKALIRTLPSSVDQAYEAILSKIGRDSQPQAWKIFHIIIAAFRPFTLKEMNIALAIEEDHHSFIDLDLDSEARFEASLKDICGLFVTVIDQKVYLIHHTAKEFLIAKSEELTDQRKRVPNTSKSARQLEVEDILRPQHRNETGMNFKVNLTQAHALMTKICLQYLTLSDFDVPPTVVTEISRMVSPTIKYSFLEYAAVNWHEHLQYSGVHCFGQPGLKPYFHSKLFWFLHPEQHQVRYRTWQQITRRVYPGESAYTLSPLCFALWMDLQVLVDILLPELSDVNSYFKDGFTCLTAAAGGNNVSMVQKLLELGANINLPTQYKRLTPLHLAAENACEETVEVLVAAGAFLHSRSESWTTPFYRAARGGSVRILSLLHDKGCEVDARTWDDWTPLMEAVENGHESAVKLLLAWGANPRNISPYGSTPLTLANDHGRTNLYRILEEAVQNLREDS